MDNGVRAFDGLVVFGPGLREARGVSDRRRLPRPARRPCSHPLVVFSIRIISTHYGKTVLWEL